MIGSATRRERLPAVGLGPGLVVLSDGADEASATPARTAPDAPMATKLKRLDAVRGSLRVLHSYGDLRRRRGRRVNTVVGGHDFAASGDTLTLYLTQRGRTGRVLLGSAAQRSNILTRDYQPEGIAVSGAKVRMRIVTRPGTLGDHHNAATIAGTVEPELIYRCGPAGSGSVGPPGASGPP